MLDIQSEHKLVRLVQSIWKPLNLLELNAFVSQFRFHFSFSLYCRAPSFLPTIQTLHEDVFIALIFLDFHGIGD